VFHNALRDYLRDPRAIIDSLGNFPLETRFPRDGNLVSKGFQGISKRGIEKVFKGIFKMFIRCKIER